MPSPSPAHKAQYQQYVITVTLQLDIKAESESVAKFKAAAYIAAGSIEYGEGDVRLLQRNISSDHTA